MDSNQTNEADLKSVDEMYGVIENLAAMEEHFLRSAKKTGNIFYADAAKEIRTIRAKNLKHIWPYGKSDGELWCIGKHLPVTSMRLMESAIKYFSNESMPEELRNKIGMQLLEDASEIKGLFVELRRMKLKEEKPKEDDLKKEGMVLKENRMTYDLKEKIKKINSLLKVDEWDKSQVDAFVIGYRMGYDNGSNGKEDKLPL